MTRWAHHRRGNHRGKGSRPPPQIAAERRRFWLTICFSSHRGAGRPRGRALAIVVLGNSQRPAVQRHIDRVVEAVNAATPGSYREVEIPVE